MAVKEYAAGVVAADPDEAELREMEGEEAAFPDGSVGGSNPVTALATRSGGALIPAGPGTINQFTGNIQYPWLGICQGVGGLANSGKYRPGDLVLAKDHLLAHAGEPLRAIVWQFKEYYKEYMPKYVPGVIAKTFWSPAEAHAAGFTTERDPITNALPTAPIAMLWFLLIEKPKDLLCELFCIREGDREYAPAKMAVERSAYYSVSQTFGTAARWTCKERGIGSAVWGLSTVTYKARTGNVTWVPKITLVEHMPDNRLKALKSVFEGGVSGEDTVSAEDLAAGQ
jgi:hypothetical protein